MTYLVVLSEGSLAAFLWLAARRRNIRVLTVQPWLPFLRRPLEGLVAFLVGHAWVRAEADLESFLVYQESWAPGWKTTDVYRRAEPWIDRRFGFAEPDAQGYPYAFPFKNVTVNHFQWHLGLFHVIVETARRFPEKTLVLVGADRETLDFHDVCHGKKSFRARPSMVPCTLVNAFLALAVIGAALRRIAGWVRLAGAEPRPVLLGVDVIADHRLRAMLEEITDDPAQILCVFRNAGEYARARQMFEPFPACPLNDGALTPAGALRTVVSVFGHGLGLWWRFRRLGPKHFLAIAKFPLIEASYKALMEKYRFAHFLGRDDYNVEHIFRSLELRRHGGTSHGISHGTGYDLEPVWRYLNFDIYYTFGEDYFRTLYTDRWPAGHRLEAVGSFGMSSDQRRRIEAPRPPDIVFFIKVFVEGFGMADAVGEIARAFPERTVYMKLKDSERRVLAPADVERLRDGLPPNVRFTLERPADLLLKARYAVSTPSTVVLEAIEAHSIAFCYDVFPRTAPFYYRDYPGLCYRTVAEIIARIRAIEAGEWTYPREAYGGLIDLSGTDVCEVIRAELGLLPARRGAADVPPAAGVMEKVPGE